MGRILVIRGGAIGDFVLTLPVLSALRNRFPRASIEILGYPSIACLARIGDLAHAVHPIEARPLAGFFARNGTLDPAMSDFFARFDVILSYLYDPDGIFRENVLRCSRAQYHQGPHRPNERESRHAVDTFLEPLQRLAIFDAEAVPRLEPERRLLGSGAWVALHPGSGSESKNWPEPRWRELVERLIGRTVSNVVLVGGEAEGERLERLASVMPADRVQIVRNQPLDDLAGILRGCAHFIGHDSGITHLASAVGLPCLVLWGPTNPDIWRPRGDRVLLIQADAGLLDLPCDTVWKILLDRFEPTPVPPASTPVSPPPASPPPG